MTHKSGKRKPTSTVRLRRAHSGGSVAELLGIDPPEKEPPKREQKPVVTRGYDKHNRLTDYVWHAECRGHGCGGCKGLGFTKHLVKP